ncbi:hypothetical protein BHE74_00014177 [Ensete ventricosum]|nr:hypothetical protein BHE74_00014177 [Ensete ventricosum]
MNYANDSSSFWLILRRDGAINLGRALAKFSLNYLLRDVGDDRLDHLGQSLHLVGESEEGLGGDGESSRLNTSGERPGSLNSHQQWLGVCVGVFPSPRRGKASCLILRACWAAATSFSALLSIEHSYDIKPSF